MNAPKIEYSLTKCYNYVLNNSVRHKEKKFLHHLQTFYTEGIKDKKSALLLRDELEKKLQYENRFRLSVGNLNNFYSSLLFPNSNTSILSKFCSKTKLYNKLFSLR